MPKLSLLVLRAFSVLDGASFLYLLFHAIYSKRIMGDAEAIQTPGMIHGIVFCALLVALATTAFQLKWPFHRPALVLGCALIPFAPFLLELSLGREQKLLNASK